MSGAARSRCPKTTVLAPSLVLGAWCFVIALCFVIVSWKPGVCSVGTT